jgi:hypothetical protein
MLTDINDIGKRLSNTGFYLVNIETNELISSSIKDTAETFQVSTAVLDEKYSEYLPYLRYAVDGTMLSRILKGTGVNIEVKNETTIEITSKVKVKDEKVDTKWTSSDFNRPDIQYDINKKLGKIRRAMKKLKDTEYYSSYEYDPVELKEKNKFIMNISKLLKVTNLKLSNKVLKTLNKDTLRVMSHVTKPIINTTDQIKRFHIIETFEKQGVIRSYYPFIDKQH